MKENYIFSRLYRLNPLGEGMLYAYSERGHFLGLPRVRRTRELNVVVCCVVTGTVGSTGGKVIFPVSVRLDMFRTEVENCGVSFGKKGCSLMWHSSDEMHQHF